MVKRFAVALSYRQGGNFFLVCFLQLPKKLHTARATLIRPGNDAHRGEDGMATSISGSIYFSGLDGTGNDWAQTLEQLKQIESMMLVRNYKGFLND